MTDKIDDGGPAFPVAEDHNTADLLPWTAGMTLRDYFAASALNSLLGKEVIGYTIQGAIKDAYAVADAMLAERAKKRGD